MPDGTSISELLDAAPVGVHVGVAVAMLSGLVIWAYGRQLFRPLLTLTGLVVGAGLGLIASGMVPYEVSIWWPVGIGIVVVGAVSLAAYRFVTAFLLAASLALALPLGHFTYAEISGKYDNEPVEMVSEDELLAIPGLRDEELKDRINATLDRQVERLDSVADDILNPGDNESAENAGAADEDAVEAETAAETETHSTYWREHLKETIVVVSESAALNWSDAPGPLKLMSVMLALGGFFGGFLGGMMMPRAATAVVSALVGSLIFLTCGTWLAAWSAIPVGSLRPDTPTKMLIFWLGIAVIGLAIQLSLRTRPADKGRD